MRFLFSTRNVIVRFQPAGSTEISSSTQTDFSTEYDKSRSLPQRPLQADSAESLDIYLKVCKNFGSRQKTCKLLTESDRTAKLAIRTQCLKEISSVFSAWHPTPIDFNSFALCDLCACRVGWPLGKGKYVPLKSRQFCKGTEQCLQNQNILSLSRQNIFLQKTKKNWLNIKKENSLQFPSFLSSTSLPLSNQQNVSVVKKNPTKRSVNSVCACCFSKHLCL